MRARGVFFFGEIFQDHGLERFIGAGREHAEVPGKGFDVTVILRGVETQRFAGELAGLPVLIERMPEETLTGDGGVDFIEKLVGGHQEPPSSVRSAVSVGKNAEKSVANGWAKQKSMTMDRLLCLGLGFFLGLIQQNDAG